jgi:transposase
MSPLSNLEMSPWLLVAGSLNRLRATEGMTKMPSGLLTMSIREVERIAVIRQVAEKQLKQSEAMSQLGLSKRQVIRLVKRYRKEGSSGLVSQKRGSTGNRKHPAEFKSKVEQLVRAHYVDFGPTFAAEKLASQEVVINKETLRQWMTEWGLWEAKRHRQAKVHQSRERRACFGELIQGDGSHHDWFEGRAEKCCLLVLVDDATSRLVGLRFEE